MYTKPVNFEHHHSPESAVPSDFHSLYEGRPFCICTVCGESLRHFAEGYQVSRMFHGEEVVLEYAICAPCYQNLVKDFSEHSVRSILDFHEQRARQPQNDPGEPDYGCEFCENHRFQLVESKKQFVLCGFFIGDRLLQGPLFACEDCILDLNSCISEETRRRKTEFFDDHFPGVPAGLCPDLDRIPTL